MLFDTHCHLTLIDALSLNEQVEAFRQARLTHFLDGGLCLTDFFRRKDYLTKLQRAAYEFKLFLGIALAPHTFHKGFQSSLSLRELGDIESNLSSWIDELEMFLQKQQVSAFCEIGLDYMKMLYSKSFQNELFEIQLVLAKQYNLPVFLHLRGDDSVFSDALFLLKKVGVQRGAVHCFTGNLQNAKQFLTLGFHLSFSGIVTFKKVEYLREIVEFSPIEQILTETDSPYLSPVPHRGKPNHPGNLVYINQVIAQRKGVNIEGIAEQLMRNGIALLGDERGVDFGIPGDSV